MLESSKTTAADTATTLGISRVDLQKRALNSLQTLFDTVIAMTTSSKKAKTLAKSPSFGPSSKLGKTIQSDFLNYIQHIRDHFSQDKGLEFLEFLHRLHFDLLEPQLTPNVPAAALQTLTATFTAVIQKLFVEVPKTMYTPQAWQGVWGHCLKSILVLLNTIFELTSNDAVWAFHTVSPLLIHLVASSDIFYRIQCEAMNCFVLLVARAAENKKYTRQHYLAPLFQALVAVPSVELQLLMIETIYRVLPALRHLRRQALAPFHLEEVQLNHFLDLDPNNFEKVSRALVHLINGQKSAATQNKADYPATIKLSRIVYHEDGTKLATPLGDGHFFYLDLTPDAMIFTCTFEGQEKETIFDLPYENIAKYYCLPHLRQVEFTALRVPKWLSPKQYGTATFFFAVRDDASMLTLTQCLHAHCRPTVLPKLSRLQTPHAVSPVPAGTRWQTFFVTQPPPPHTAAPAAVGDASPAMRTATPPPCAASAAPVTPPSTTRKPLASAGVGESSGVEKIEGETGGGEKGDMPASTIQRAISPTPAPASPIPTPRVPTRTPPPGAGTKRAREPSAVSPVAPPVSRLRVSPAVPAPPPGDAPHVASTTEEVQREMQRVQELLCQMEQQGGGGGGGCGGRSSSRSDSGGEAAMPTTTSAAAADIEGWAQSFGHLLAQGLRQHDRNIAQWQRQQDQHISQRLRQHDQTMAQMVAAQEQFEKKAFGHLQERLEQVMTMIDMKTKAMENALQVQLLAAKQLLRGAERMLEKSVAATKKNQHGSG